MSKVKLTTKYTLSDIDKKLIKIMKYKVMHSFLKPNFDFTFHTQKHTITHILKVLLAIIKLNHSWRHITKYTTYYKRFIQLQQIKLFQNTYIDLLHKYLYKTKNKTLHTLYTDTTIIQNKNGVDFKKRSKYINNKNCNKLSFVVDSNFVPVYINVYTGNVYDSKIIRKDFKNKQLSNHLKYCKYFIADKGYCSEEIRMYLRNINISPVIDFNQRGTKNQLKIKKLTESEMKIYKNRNKIEHIFAHLKEKQKLNQRHEKYIQNYVNFVYLFLCEAVMKMM